MATEFSVIDSARILLEGGVGSVAITLLYKLVRDNQKGQIRALDNMTKAITTIDKGITAIDKGMSLLQQEVEAHVSQVRDVSAGLTTAIKDSKNEILTELRRSS